MAFLAPESLPDYVIGGIAWGTSFNYTAGVKMDKQSMIDQLMRQAAEASRAADDIELALLVKRAQLEPQPPAEPQGLPDFSTSEIDPEEVYRFLVEMLGEEKAQEVLLQASADAIEAGMDDMEGRAPTQEDLAALFQNAQEGGEDSGSSDLPGEDGLSDEWAGWKA